MPSQIPDKALDWSNLSGSLKKKNADGINVETIGIFVFKKKRLEAGIGLGNSEVL